MQLLNPLSHILRLPAGHEEGMVMRRVVMT
jgi:hypothetical protein